MLEPKEHGHLSEEQIVQFALEMAGDEESRHLQGCELCRSEAESYRRTLAHLGHWSAPGRAPDYGYEVWRKLAPQVRRRARWLRPAVWGWATVAAVGALLALTLLVPRHGTMPNRLAQGTESVAVPARLLQAAVKDHVQRADQLLSQIETQSGERAVTRLDVASEREAIRDLIAENRLYRQTAEQEDDRRTAGLLADLETALVALKHDPQRVSAADARVLRNRLMKAEGLNRPGTRDVSSSGSETQGVKRVPL
ncbi:MAG: hypothetical protein WB676_24165 [Bryobacteraceae bacterium]